MAEKVVFKKYANRRLYDTRQSAYVTLSDITEMIRQGIEVEVREAKTDEDVTAFILTQILLEEARTKKMLLPVPLMHLIIRFGDNVLGEFMEKYLQQIMQTYLSHKAAFDDHFGDWIGVGMNFTDAARQTLADLSPLKSFYDFYSGRAGSPKEEEKKEND